MTEVDVAWAPMTLPDVTCLLLAKGAAHVTLDAAGRIHRQRKAIEELRAEARPPIPWLQSRPSQLATFYALLANWLDDRALLADMHGVDYLGGDQ